jgi:hypothetical protein
MPRTGPRLFGLAVVPLERQLKGAEIGCRFGFEETIQAATMHQIGTDQSGEGEWAFDGGLCRLGEAEEQKGDQCDGDLDAHGIFRGPEKAANFEGLFDPAEDEAVSSPEWEYRATRKRQARKLRQNWRDRGFESHFLQRRV